jgi:putative endopeptidase
MMDLRALIASTAVLLTCTSAVAGDVTAGPVAAAGDDFYSYANSAWLKTTQLPEGATKLDTTSMLRAENARRVRLLIENSVETAKGAGPKSRSDVHKIADYYLSLIDTASIEAKGLAPLAGELANIAAIRDRRTLAAELGRTVRLDDGGNQRTESLWGVWIHQNFHDPEHYAVHLVQGGLGLSEPADYMDPAPAEAARRADYRLHIATALRLAGLDLSDARAVRVLELETAIARIHASRADTDDVFKTDNPWHRADFEANAPGFAWDAYFSAAGLDHAQSFVVWQPQALVGSAKLVAAQPLDTWKDYLTFHLIEHYASVLPKANGSKSVQSNVEAEALAATEAAFGDALGRLYVERYFPPREKLAASAMVENIRTAFRSRLAHLPWMTPATRLKALAKLAALRIGLGYPETWTDYSSLTIVRGDAFGNLQRLERFAYERERAKLSRPVDQNEWAGQLHPQMVGAVLNISPNTMQFAAGLMQSPFFEARGDKAANYGSAGAGIAHEISHSFDELGNQYDARGRLGVWWSKNDFAGYRAVSDALVTQLGGCRPGHGIIVRGMQVRAESTSDLGGLMVAYDAYQISLGGKPDRIRDGLTGDQRFFIAFARRWRRLQTDADMIAQNTADNHALPLCRSNLVQNMAAWVRAFDVKPGDKLYARPEDRVRIW